MYDNDDEYVFLLDEEVDDSSIENFIYQEVVNTKEKERRSQIKADYIKKHGANSSDDDIKYTPSIRSTYKNSHDRNQREKISGERDMTAKDTTGYTRLYGKEGKRDASGYGDSQYKGTPERQKDGVFKKRYNLYAMHSREVLVPTIKMKARENKINREEKERTKDVPHKDKIDKIANKLRDSYAASKAKQFEKLSDNKKVPKIVRDYVNSPDSDINKWAAHYYASKETNGEINKAINKDSHAVNLAYSADRAISKGAKKAKEVAKKFVAKKLKNNRSAKSEDADLFDIDNDWDNDL